MTDQSKTNGSKFREGLGMATATDPSDRKSPRKSPRKRRGERFNRYALIFFTLVQVIYLALGGFAIYMVIAGWEKVSDFDNNGHPGRRSEAPTDVQELKLPPITGEVGWMFLAATGICFVCNLVLLITMKYMARIYVWLGPAVFMICAHATIIVTALQKQWLLCGVWCLGVIFFAILLYVFRERMALAKHLLALAGKIAAKSNSVYFLVVIGLLVQFALATINIFATVGWFLVFQPEHEGCGRQALPCSLALAIIGCLFLLMAHSWMSAVVSNAILMALAGGPFSRTYFGLKQEPGGAFRALKHSLKKPALGTLAFGTLFVGVVQAAHGLLSPLRKDTNNWLIAIPAFLLSWLIKLVEQLLEWFNKYAFIFCAIGKREAGVLVIEPFEETYWEAAKHCINFVKRSGKGNSKDTILDKVKKHGAQNHGISAIVNDDMTTSALCMACIANAGLCSLLTWVFRWAQTGSIAFHGWFDMFSIMYAFILGLTIGLLTTSALDIGVSTLFVCMSEKISCLQELDPRFYRFVNRHYAEMFEEFVRTQTPPSKEEVAHVQGDRTPHENEKI